MLTFVISEFYTKSKGGEKCDKSNKSHVVSKQQTANKTV